MKTALAFLIGFLAALELVAVAHAARPFPGVVIVCEKGGVVKNPDDGLLSSASSCVLHDRQGGTATAESISVYDNGIGP